MMDPTFGGYKIISSENSSFSKKENLAFPKTAVLIHLYYPETIPSYFRYIANIPSYITKIFTYSSSDILTGIQQELLSHHCEENCVFIEKENRGRDVSALLVAACEKLLKYDLICFVHDKKEKNDFGRELTEDWCRCLWENTLGSRIFIENVLTEFTRNPQMGGLFPPYFSSRRQKLELKSLWGVDYENTQALGEKLGLSVRIRPEMESCAVGTVFWARTAALKKLLSYPWTYDMFPEEPLPNDGTISHAIERIIRFVSMDAGYKEYFGVSSRYAEYYLWQMQSDTRQMYEILDGQSFVNARDIDFYSHWTNRLWSFVSRFQSIYIWGTGHYGIQCFRFLRNRGRQAVGFVTTNAISGEKCEGFPVTNIDELEMESGDCLIVAMASENYSDIKQAVARKNREGQCIISENILYYQDPEYF